MSGFRIKSSHPYVNPNPIEEPEPEPESYFSTGYSLAPAQAAQDEASRPSTNTISDVRTGSAGGMAIRQSVGGMADLY